LHMSTLVFTKWQNLSLTKRSQDASYTWFIQGFGRRKSEHEPRLCFVKAIQLKLNNIYVLGLLASQIEDL
jgi:hypothetical protein